MKAYELNVNKTNEIYGEYGRHMVKKECYRNVYRVVTEYMTSFKARRWRVAYGYFSISENLLVRHCFILDENGDVIDPTLPIVGIPEGAKYFTFKEYDEIDDYFQAIDRSGGYAALVNILGEQDARFISEARHNGYLCIG